MGIKHFLVVALAALSFSATAVVKEDLTHPDVEIWLSEGMGRFGDREFQVRGGSKENPTPTGAFTVDWKSRKWWSRQYDAAMPYAMFYHKGAALHVGSMRGHSHGCVRLNESDAKLLYYATKEKQTRVFVYP